MRLVTISLNFLPLASPRAAAMLNRPQHAKPTRIAHRRNDIAAMGEGEEWKFDSLFVAYIRFHYVSHFHRLLRYTNRRGKQRL